MPNDAKIQDVALNYIRKAVVGDCSRWPSTTLGVVHLSLMDRLAVEPGELILVSAFFSEESWYAFTTRRFVSQFRGRLQSIDPSRGIRENFGNFKGSGPGKPDDTLPKARVVPMEVATITASDSGEVVRFEFETGEASMLPIQAARYWVVKHPVIEKLMTTAELEYYKRNIAVPRTPRGRPVKSPRELAQEIVKWHARGIVSTSELWDLLLSRATPTTLPDFMCEFTPEIHAYFREVVLANPSDYRTDENGAFFEALKSWYDSR